MRWLIVLGLLTGGCLADWTTELKVPRFYFHVDTRLRNRCREEGGELCATATKLESNVSTCWGYEADCELTSSLTERLSECSERSSWAGSKQRELWLDGADFGYVRQRISTVESICESEEADHSSLSCDEHMRLCFATNLLIDLRNLHADTSKRYRSDVLRKGDVKAYCDTHFQPELLAIRSGSQRGYLQSWAQELELVESDSTLSIDEEHCEVIFDRPTVVIKLDASVSLYHHMCDFLNLYATLHANGSFSDDIDIVWWDTHVDGFEDPWFRVVWRAFTRHEPVELVALDQKRVCFRRAVFSLLARQRNGLFYNTALVDGCRGSALFHSFREHVLFRLGIIGSATSKRSAGDPIRVTLLTRSTSFRRLLNIRQIMNTVRQQLPDDMVHVRVIDFNTSVPFEEQLAIVADTDVLAGMHGSGLTHLLFLPRHAALFEIYNCGDTGCYSELARIRGIHYVTWEDERMLFKDDGGYKHPSTGEAHAKFANYSLDPAEFVRLLKKAIRLVCQNRRLRSRKICRQMIMKDEL